MVRNKALYLALGVLPDGTRDILGLWIEGTEGAKFWIKVFNDLETLGVADILIAVTDGLKGMLEALGAAFPATTLQTCIVHLVRKSLDYASHQADLHGARRRVRASRAGRLQAGPLWPQVPHRRCCVAPRLGPRAPVLGVPAGRAPGDLQDQGDREHQRAPAQNHQVARSLPERRRGDQADLAGAAQHHRRLGPISSQLE